MMQFAERFPDERIAQTLSAQLSWSQFVELTPIVDRLKREFYAEMCRVERWSVRTLRNKIGHLLFERTAVSKKPDELIEQDITALRGEDRLTPDMVCRDPYILDFLGLTGSHVERDVEEAILNELEAFILELGSDFAFVARQKRIAIDNEEEGTGGQGSGVGESSRSSSPRGRPLTWRRRWPDDFRDEVLARLLGLNEHRHQEELLAGQKKLRKLHDDMDRAVLRAYGWVKLAEDATGPLPKIRAAAEFPSTCEADTEDVEKWRLSSQTPEFIAKFTHHGIFTT